MQTLESRYEAALRLAQQDRTTVNLEAFYALHAERAKEIRAMEHTGEVDTCLKCTTVWPDARTRATRYVREAHASR